MYERFLSKACFRTFDKMSMKTALVAVHRLGALLVLLAPNAAGAQVQLDSGAVEITLTGRVHMQYRTTSVDGARSSEFLLRRARLTAQIKVDDFIEGFIQPDFGEGKFSLKDAYLRLNFDPAFRLSFGQFKRPFGIFELYSSTQILTIERTGKIDGVDACAGPGGVCSWSRLTEALQYSDRDIGILVDGRATDELEYRFSITNGTGANERDENGTKSYTARVVVQAASHVRLGANVGVHDYFDSTTDDEYAVAYGGDIEIGRYGDEFHLQAGFLTGQNWLNLDATRDPSTFLTAQGVASYRIPITGSSHFTAVEPLARLSWANPDTDAANAGGWLFTPGIALRMAGRNMLVANVDVWSPGAGDFAWSFKFQSFLHF